MAESTYNNNHSLQPGVFKDRKEAGRLLAARFKALSLKDPLVLAIPRGGIVVAYEVSRSIGCELDLVVPRKLGAPREPELAIGAVMPDGSLFLNQHIVDIKAVPRRYIEQEKKAQMEEALRRMREYRGKRAYPELRGRDVILIDDGIATGATMIAAARWIRKQHPGRLIIAVPVAPEDTLYELKEEADELICLLIPPLFFAIGQFYEQFEQVNDQAVITILKEHWEKPG